MELTSAIEAVTSLWKPETKIIVVTDSQYVIKCATEWWLKWQTNGWVNAKKEPVKNKELIEELIAKTWERGVSFRWVKGHSGDPGNEEADRLATEASGADLQLVTKCKDLYEKPNGYQKRNQGSRKLDLPNF